MEKSEQLLRSALKTLRQLKQDANLDPYAETLVDIEISEIDSFLNPSVEVPFSKNSFKTS